MKLLLLVLGAVLVASPARAYCFNEAGSYYGIAPVVLYSIAEHESGMNPDLELRNTNGSIDVGLMGVNSINFEELRRVGMNPDRLKEPCFNVIAGTYLLSKKVLKHGYTWDAIGAYHSETPERLVKYRGLIQARISRKLNK